MADLDSSRFNYQGKSSWSPGELVTATEMTHISKGVSDLFDDTQRIAVHYNNVGTCGMIRHNKVSSVTTSSSNGLTEDGWTTGYGYLIDSLNEDIAIGGFTAGGHKNGKIAAAIEANNYSTDSEHTKYRNQLMLMVDKSGNCSYYLSDSAAFRKAIQIPEIQLNTTDKATSISMMRTMTESYIPTLTYISQTCLNTLIGINKNFFGLCYRSTQTTDSDEKYRFFGYSEDGKIRVFQFRITSDSTFVVEYSSVFDTTAENA